MNFELKKTKFKNREESILDSDKTVEDIDAPDSEEMISIGSGF